MSMPDRTAEHGNHARGTPELVGTAKPAAPACPTLARRSVWDDRGPEADHARRSRRTPPRRRWRQDALRRATCAQGTLTANLGPTLKQGPPVSWSSRPAPGSFAPAAGDPVQAHGAIRGYRAHH